MKTTMISLALIFALVSFIPKDGNYEKAMHTSISTLHEAKNIEGFQKAAHQFERIAQAEENEWLPRYYAAYAYITMAAIEQDGSKKDEYLDQATPFVNEAMQLKKNESELVALQGYLHMIRLTADPATRGQEMAPKATALLAKAHEMNPENPRALLLLGQMQFGSAQHFGASVKEPCAMIQKSIEMFENQPQTKDSLMPTWGLYIARTYQDYCNKNQ